MKEREVMSLNAEERLNAEKHPRGGRRRHPPPKVLVNKVSYLLNELVYLLLTAAVGIQKLKTLRTETLTFEQVSPSTTACCANVIPIQKCQVIVYRARGQVEFLSGHFGQSLGQQV